MKVLHFRYNSKQKNIFKLVAIDDSAVKLIGSKPNSDKTANSGI